MDREQFFYLTSLQYQVADLKRQVESFRSGAVYVRLRNEYRSVISEKDRTISRLISERDDAVLARKNNTKMWLETIDYLKKQHAKELGSPKKTISELRIRLASEILNCAELRQKYNSAREEIEALKKEAEDKDGIIMKLQAQANHDYENSSISSSKCINRKKITNNREKPGRKPGAQPGHGHHPRKRLEPDEIKTIPPEKRFADTSRYVPTGNTLKKQVIGISITGHVTEYRTEEFYDKKKGRNVHASFPAGVTDDVSYDDSIKAVAFMLNSVCNVSAEKTRGFISDITGGAINPSVGMINGLCNEFSSKSGDERKTIFKRLLDAPAMNTDFTSLRINGKSSHVLVCCNDGGTVYLAREHKGHEGIKGSPVEIYGGILIHDHDKTFYGYGSDHQECMVHILRYLKDSMDNEPDLTWNADMHSLIREMIRAKNISDCNKVTEAEYDTFSKRYDEIIQTACYEYEKTPPSRYYPDGYNLYERLSEYRHNSLLFLASPFVEADNNLAERKARIIKGKLNQMISVRDSVNFSYYYDALSVIDYYRNKNSGELYETLKQVFRRQGYKKRKPTENPPPKDPNIDSETAGAE